MPGASRIATDKDPERLYTGKLRFDVPSFTTETIDHNLHRLPVFDVFFNVIGNDTLVPIPGFREATEAFYTTYWGGVFVLYSVNEEFITIYAQPLAGAKTIEVTYIIYPERGVTVV